MALKSRKPNKKEPPSAHAASTATAEPSLTPEDGEGASTKLPSHLSHHRMLARTLNNLIEAFNELSKETRETSLSAKRSVKDLDASLYRLRNEVHQFFRDDEGSMQQLVEMLSTWGVDLRKLEAEIKELWAVVAEIGGLDPQVLEARRERARAAEQQRLEEIAKEWQAVLEAEPPPATARHGDQTGGHV